MKKRYPYLLPLLLLFARCDGSTSYPESFQSLPPLYTDDSLFILCPISDTLARIDSETLEVSSIPVGLDPVSYFMTPDSGRVLVMDREGATLFAIDADSLEYASLPIVQNHNTLKISPDSQFAITFFHYSSFADIDVEDYVNLNQVVVADLNRWEVTEINIGFNPEKVLFTSDSEKAVIISSSQVSLLDLSDYSRVTYPLTQTGSTQQKPFDLLITSDDSHAIVSLEESSDIYIIDLENPSINIVSGSKRAPTLFSSADGEYTLLVYENSTIIDKVKNSDFSVDPDPITLSSKVNRHVHSEGNGEPYLILYNDESTSNKYIYHLDLNTFDVTSYLMENPVKGVKASPDSPFAVVFHRKESEWGSSSGGFEEYFDTNEAISIVNFNEKYPTPIVVEEEPLDAAFYSSTTGDYFAFLIMEGSRSLLRFDLLTGNADVKEVFNSPHHTEILGDWQTLFVIHDLPEGAVTFVEPESLEVSTVTGYTLYNIFD